MTKKTPIIARGKMTGHHWEFFGGAESSYMATVRDIAQDPGLSKRRKQELIDHIDHLVAHVISDADFQIRNDYTSAHSSGIRYMSWRDLTLKPGRFLSWLLGDTLRNLRMQVHLNDITNLHNIKRRIAQTQRDLNERVLNQV